MINSKIKNRIYYYDDDLERMINILIYNIIRENSNITIVVGQEKHKTIILSKLKSKGLWISDEVKIIEEEEFLRTASNNETHIIMFSNIINNYKRVDEKIGINKGIIIGKKGIEQISTNENRLLEESQHLLRYRERWGNKRFLYDDEVKYWILDSINIAKNNIFLECPWFNKEAFKIYRKPIINAVNRGVDVRVKYGIKCDTDKRYIKTEEVITDLELEVGDKTNFKLIKSNTHKKIAFIDNFYLLATLNYCSNDMKYENSPDEGATINILSNRDELELKYKEFEVK